MARTLAPDTYGRSTVRTACPLDCPDSCTLDVTVEKGRVVKIDGGPTNPVTRNFICAKVRRFGERVYGEDRLLYPAIRKGPKGQGVFTRVTWDEALEEIARRMVAIRDTTGAEAILPFCYGGSNGLLTQDTNDARLFRAFGTSRLARTVCAAPTGAANQALYGKMPCVTYADYVHARLIVLWGVNPSASGIHLVPYLRAAQRAGATLVVIDPRATALARQADLHLAPRPGTDLPIALALHRFLFEGGFADERFLEAHTRGAAALRARADEWTIERAADVAGIDPAALTRFAQLYSAASPALVRCGWGLERNRNGGSAAAAVLALPAVAGKFGVRGGGFSMSNSSAFGIKSAEWMNDTPEPATRLVNMNHLGRALLEFRDPPVDMLFVYNCNPLATMPDQNRVLEGLKREDLFTVVYEQVFTDTARYADVLLPATTFLENYDIAKGYGPDQPAARAPGDRAVRRGASERRSLLGSRQPPRSRRSGARDRHALQNREPDAAPSLVRAAGDRLGHAAVRRRTDPVRRRVPADRRPEGGPVSRSARRGRPRRLVRVPAGSGHGSVPAGPDLPGEREDDHVDARRAARSGRQCSR